MRRKRESREGRAGAGSAPAAAAPASPARWPLPAIVAATLVLGLGCVWQYRGSPFWSLPILDEASYWEWAISVADGDVLGKKTYYQDPLYPYALAVVVTVLGKSLAVVRVLQAIGMAMAVAIVYLPARALLGHRGGLLAAGLLAACHVPYFFAVQIEKSILVLLCAAASCALGVAAARARAPAAAFGLGFTLGLLTLLRGNVQAMLPVLLLWGLLAGGGWLAGSVRAGLMALGIASALLPVTIRNHAVSGEWVLTTSQGGANFYIGNNPLATGRYVTLPFVRANPLWEAEDFEREAEKRAGRELSPAEISRFWFAESFRFMREHPGPAALLWLHKARLVLHDYEIPDNHSFYVTRGLFVPLLWVPFVGVGLLWAPAAVGAVVTARRDPNARYPALYLLLYAGSLVPFFVLDRYRVPMLPPLAIFAAAGILRLRDAWRAGQARALRGGLGACALLWLVAFVPTAESRSPVAVEYFLIGNAYLKQGRPEAAVPWIDKALAVYPEREDFRLSRTEALRQMNRLSAEELLHEVRRPDASAARLLDFGRSLEKMGHVAAAVESYERAAQKDPADPSPHARLGYLYLTAPQVKETRRAEVHLLEAHRLRPADADTMNALGNLYFIVGDRAKAEEWWRRTLQAAPGHPGATQNLARVR